MVRVGDHAAVGEHAVLADLDQVERGDHHADVEEAAATDPHACGRRHRYPDVWLEQHLRTDLEAALA